MKKFIVSLMILAIASCSFGIYNPSRFPNGLEANIISGDRSTLKNDGTLLINATTLNVRSITMSGSGAFTGDVTINGVLNVDPVQVGNGTAKSMTIHAQDIVGIGNAGTITLRGGTVTGTGNGGDAYLQAGSGSSGAVGAGKIYISTGTGLGGDINISAGTSTGRLLLGGGTNGSVQILTGNLGIGGAPAAGNKLDLNGTMSFGQNASYGDPSVQDAYRIKLSDPTGTANDIGFGLSGTTEAWFNHGVNSFATLTGKAGTSATVWSLDRTGGAYLSGNVGIGITSPGAKLHVSGNVAGQPIFRAESGTALNALVVSQNGNVGIGTTAPTSPLYINGALEFSNLNSAPAGPGIYQGLGYVQIRSGTAGFSVNNNVNGAMNMFIANNGNVGIGVSLTNPGARLYVSGNTTGLPIFKAESSTALNALVVSQNGNVGIGTTGPNTKLEVAGTVSASALQVNGPYGGGDVNTIYFRDTNVVGIGTILPVGKLDVVGSSIMGDWATRNTSGQSSSYGLNIAQTSGQALRFIKPGVVKVDFVVTSNPLRLDYVDSDHSSVVPLSIKLDGTSSIEVAGTVSASALQVNGATQYISGSNIGLGTPNVVIPDTGMPTLALQGTSALGTRSGSVQWKTLNGDGAYAHIYLNKFDIASDTSIPLRLLANNTVAVTVSQNGNVGVGAGITNPSTALEVAGTVSANQFGTDWTAFTPTFNAGLTMDSVVYSYYQKVGKEVTVRLYINATSAGDSSATGITIGGLPFLTADTSGVGNVILGSLNVFQDQAGTPTYLNAIVRVVAAGSNRVRLQKSAFLLVTNADCYKAQRGIEGSFTYTAQ